MFGILKDSWFFAQVSTTAMQRFNIDLKKSDVATSGFVNDVIKKSRRYGFTRDEAAASCVALVSLALAEQLDLSGQRPDYRKMNEIEKIVAFMHAQELIRDPVYEEVDATIQQYYDLLEKKTGVKMEYP